MWRVEIRVQGRIAEHWSEWFEGLTITYADDVSILTGNVIDQPALFGLLSKVRDLGLSLLSARSEQITPEVETLDQTGG